MFKKKSLITPFPALLACVLFVVGCAKSSEEKSAQPTKKVFRYCNPIRSDVIGPIRDPQIINVGDTYYLTGTTHPFWPRLDMRTPPYERMRPQRLRHTSRLRPHLDRTRRHKNQRPNIHPPGNRDISVCVNRNIGNTLYRLHG